MKEIQLLIFNIMGVKIGVDTEQIYGMREINRADEESLKIVKFHEKLHFGGLRVIYNSPKLLLIKENSNTPSPPGGEGKGEGAIVIDQPEDIISIPIDCIRPLPPLLESLCPSKAIWGAALKSDEIILLVDFYRLEERKPI